MNVRPATPADSQAIERIARSSFQASYALSPGDIDSIVDAYFDAETLEGRLDDATVIVAESDDAEADKAEADDADSGASVVGFAEIDSGDVLRWLHVEPTERGQGAGTALAERARDLASDEGSFEAHLLEAASEGSGFLERVGLTATGTSELEFGDGTEFPEEVYTLGGEETDANEPSVDVPATVSVDGEDRDVDGDEPIPGSEAPFFEVTTDDGERWGYFCSECGSTDVAADGLDRLACNECGNEHRAEQWDGAYL